MRLGCNCFLSALLVLMTLGAWNTSFAGLRCSHEVVSEGDIAYEVIYKCGEPQFVISWEEERIKRDHYPYSYDVGGREYPRRGYRQPFLVKEYVLIERWTYFFGSNRLTHHLIFENGILREICTGERSPF